MRKDAAKAGIPAVAKKLQGVDKDRIRKVLKILDLNQNDIVDAVFALMDPRPSWFGGNAGGVLRFCDGATTAHVACHVGILQRGKGKLDREGRDYWIKLLRDIGAIEAVILKDSKIHPGHPIPKSPNSAYCLNRKFVEILQSSEDSWSDLFQTWIDEDEMRRRLKFQAKEAEKTRRVVDTAHADLIPACCKVYAPEFLPGFEVVYVDDADGDRVSESERKRLDAAGLKITLNDAMPDVLLWNPKTDGIWVIEAVTSDGEVDNHKVKKMQKFAEKNEKSGVGFTTAYKTWKRAAERQGKFKNLAIQTHVWIQEDASKQFYADSFKV